MKLYNGRDVTVLVEIFLGPGDWYKTEAPAKSAVEVPDNLAEWIITQCGLSEVASMPVVDDGRPSQKAGK